MYFPLENFKLLMNDKNKIMNKLKLKLGQPTILEESLFTTADVGRQSI